MLKTTFSGIFYVLGGCTILLIFAMLIAPNFELEKLSYPIPFILAWFVSSVMTKRYVFDHEKMTSYY